MIQLLDALDTSPVGPSCSVAYSVHGTWRNGIIRQVWIATTGEETINGLTLSWEFTDDGEVAELWSKNVAQHRPSVEVLDWAWIAVIQAVERTTFGFVGRTAARHQDVTDVMLSGKHREVSQDT